MSVKRVKNDKIGEEIDFCWGKKKGRGGANKAVQFYESFRFDGVEYSLYDSVYLFKGGENEPYVGKLLKIWEPQKNDRKVKVLWFFRPSEISNYLEGVDVLENELFLATGEGRGLTNINPLEAIAGKCNVVCISKDSRNRQPSVEELEMADYVFYRTFDVQKFTVSDKLDEKIAMVDVKLLLNKNDLQPADLAKLDSVNVAVDVAKPLISAKDTRVADSLADCDTIVTKLVEPDELTTDFVALPKGHLSEKLGTAVSDNTVLVADVEEKAISYKDTQDIVGGVTCDAGLGSLMVEEDKQSKEEGDAAKADNMSVVPFTSKQVLEIGPKTTSKSSELNEDGKGAVTVTATGNGKSEPVNDVKKRIVAGGNKSEARLSEKLNVDSSARKTIGGGGISTQKSVNVSPASIKVSKPAGNAAETIDGGKLTCESVGISDTPPRKQKYDVGADEKSSDKCNLASGKQSKDLQNIVDKAPQHPGGAAADSNDKRKLSREQDGTSEGLLQSKEGDAAKADNMSVVPFTSKQVLEIGPKTTSKSSDLKQTELNEDGKGAVTVTASGNGKSEPVNDVKKRIAAGGNKSEARLSKKLNVDSSARKTIGGGGISTQKSVNVSPASIKVSKPAGNAAETIDGGKLTRESVGISDTLPRKQKYDVGADEKSSDKCNLASGKQSKDLQNIVDKAPQHPGGAAADSNDKRKLSREQDGTNEGLSKKRRTNSLIEHKPNDKLGEVSIKRPNDGQIGACNQVKEVTQRPLDKSKWFTASPWEDRMKDAYDQERLVLLQNLDPTYSSSEVENIVWNGFGESCTVKLVQCTATSSPHSGQAFAIFNTREVAQKVIGKLERDCLMLPNGRPLVGTNDIMSLPGKLSQYFGHLVLDKPKLQMQKEMKEAVSTSHAAQSNTLEYEMALDWILLQDRSDMWWKLLYQKQGEDMRKLKASLKSKH